MPAYHSVMARVIDEVCRYADACASGHMAAMVLSKFRADIAVLNIPDVFKRNDPVCPTPAA
jgi:hypothetical protein